MRERKHILHAIYLCFSIEALQNTQGKGCPSVGEFPFCVPSKRIAFALESDGVVVCGTSPSHANAIVYVPGAVDNTEKFTDVFRKIGVVCNVPR